MLFWIELFFNSPIKNKLDISTRKIIVEMCRFLKQLFRSLTLSISLEKFRYICGLLITHKQLLELI